MHPWTLGKGLLHTLRSPVWGIAPRKTSSPAGAGACPPSCPAVVESLTPPGKGCPVQIEYLTSLPTCGREAAETCPSAAEMGWGQV